MKLKFSSLIPLFASLLSMTAVFAYDNDCANPDPPCDDEQECCGAENSGSNPVNLYRASLSRKVTDLRTYGAAPVEFTRTYQSRTQTFNTQYWDFGMNEGWQHNWNFEVRQLSSKTHGFFDIKVRYPNGWERNFKATDSTGAQLAPTAGSGDRLYRWVGSPVGYTMVRRDGSQYDFLRYSSPKFDLKEVRNGKGFKWVLTHDTNHKVKRITNNFGRWLEIERATVGGKEVITKVKSDDAREVTFAYTAWAPTSEQTLTSVTYPGTEQAAYTWVGADSLTTGRPLLGTADDPMYGGAGARTKYVYNYTFTFDFGSGPYLVTGIIKEERNLVNDQVIISMPGGAGPYPEIREGNGTEITRKFTNARLTESRDGEGRTTTYTYDAGGFGFRASETGPNGGTTSWTRDYAGRILTETDALSNVQSWTYNAAGFELTHTNKRNYTTTITRDTSNRPTRKDFPDGTYEEWTYDTNGLVLTHRLRNTGTNTYTYNAGGNIATFTDAENHATTYTYDSAGLPATVTDPRTHTTTYDYDWRGNLLSVTHPDSTVRQFEYDVYGNKTKVIDELSNVTEYTYNEYNRVSSVKDPLNRVTSYEYGREPGCSSCGFSAVVTKITLPSGLIVEKGYDLSWKLVTETVAPGSPEEATTTYAYNAAGDLATVTNPENETTTYTYDLLHRRLTATDPLNQTTEWTYDAEGNKLSEELADATVTAFEYDAMNRQTKTIDALNAETEMTYGGGDLLVSLKDARNNVYSFEYDLCDLRTKMIYPGGSYEQWTYDGAHNMVTYRTRAAQVMTCTFDNRNRDILCDWSDWTPDTSKTYDAVGRVLTIDNEHAELTYSYDAAGQLLSEEQKILAPSLTKTVAYIYNADGLRSKITYPDGKEFTYDYTDRNQLHEINFNYLTNPLVRYTYDLAGRRTKRELNNATETNYSYDSGGRVTLLEHENSVASIDRREYGYNAVNNRTWEKRLGGLGDVYGYDGTQQVTGVQYDATNPDGTPASPARTVAYAFDAVGNRTSMVDSGTTTYSTNVRNEYVTISSLTFAPQYSTDGNLAELNGDEFGYDAQSRLTGADKNSAGLHLTYIRDGRGRKVGEANNVTWTYYFYDDWNLIEEYDANGTQIAATAHGANLDEYVFRWSAGYIFCYYHQDALGNVTTLTDTSGVVVEKISYDIFGKPLITDASGTLRTASFYGNRFFFTGREYVHGWFYDYRNRGYLPELGRFLQIDPIRFEAGDVNLYRYVANNGVNKIDPFGLDGNCFGAALGDKSKDHQPPIDLEKFKEDPQKYMDEWNPGQGMGLKCKKVECDSGCPAGYREIVVEFYEHPDGGNDMHACGRAGGDPKAKWETNTADGYQTADTAEDLMKNLPGRMPKLKRCYCCCP